MDEKTKELIAIGASVGAHCQPCLSWHVAKASELQIDEETGRQGCPPHLTILLNVTGLSAVRLRRLLAAGTVFVLPGAQAPGVEAEGGRRVVFPFGAAVGFMQHLEDMVALRVCVCSLGKQAFSVDRSMSCTICC